MTLIDLDEFMEDLRMSDNCDHCDTDWKSCHYDRDYTKMDFCNWLADARIVPLVYCKDCRYVWKDDGYDNLWCHRLSGTFAVERKGFCAWGRER